MSFGPGVDSFTIGGHVYAKRQALSCLCQTIGSSRLCSPVTPLKAAQCHTLLSGLMTLL